MSPLRTFAAGLAVAAVAVLATTLPASAHDQLVSSTPDDGERLAASPSSVSMTFSGELLVLDSDLTGAVVLVVDESGTDWVAGAVTVSGNTVTAEVDPPLPEAGYQVRWQVVSEDGHPISGVISFTVGDAAPMATASAAGTADDETTAATSAPAADQVADESGGAARVLLVGLGGAAIAVLVFALLRFLRRPRATDDL